MSTTVNFKLPSGSSLTRFSLSADSPSELFALLKSKLEDSGVPSSSLSYLDADGDQCLLNSVDELEAAIEHCGDSAILLKVEETRRSKSRSHGKRGRSSSSSYSSSSSSSSSDSSSDSLEDQIKKRAKKMKKLHKKGKKNGVRFHPFGFHPHHHKKMRKCHKRLGIPPPFPPPFGFDSDPRLSLSRGHCGGRDGFGPFGRGGFRFPGRGGFGPFSRPFDRMESSCPRRRHDFGFGERLGHSFGHRGGFGGFGRGFHQHQRPSGFEGFGGHRERRHGGFGGFGRRQRRFSEGDFF